VLLNGHVSLAVPHGWHPEVDSATYPETSLVTLELLDQETAAVPRFEIGVRELFVQTSGDVMADARAVLGEEWELEPAPDPTGRIAWAREEREPDGVRDVTVLAAVLVHDDRSLQRVLVTVLADVAAEDRADYARRARAIVAGMRSEERWSLAGGARGILDRFDTDVPPGYLVDCRPDPNLPSLRSCTMRHVPVAGTARVGLAMWIHAPADATDIVGMFVTRPTRTRQPLLGAARTWRRRANADGVVMGTSVPLDGERLDVVIAGADEGAARTLLAIVQTMRAREGSERDDVPARGAADEPSGAPPEAPSAVLPADRAPARARRPRPQLAHAAELARTATAVSFVFDTPAADERAMMAALNQRLGAARRALGDALDAYAELENDEALELGVQEATADLLDEFAAGLIAVSAPVPLDVAARAAEASEEALAEVAAAFQAQLREVLAPHAALYFCEAVTYYRRAGTPRAEEQLARYGDAFVARCPVE